MANKKITVVGDGVEEPLTPEEEHRIEVKVDQMLDPSTPDTPITSSPTDAKPARPSGSTAGPAAVENKPVEEPVAPEKPSAVAEEAPAAPVVPKVTKIVTTFADEPDEAPAAEPVDVPALVPEPPKPVVKKIVIKHHDEIEAEAAEEKTKAEAKKPAIKTSKPKAAAKKPAKKMKATVADTSAPDDLAAKADAITAAALAAEEFATTKPAPEESEIVADPEQSQEETPEIAPQPVEETESNTDTPVENKPVDEPEENLAETTDDQSGGAPPLIQKHSAAPIGAPADTEDGTAQPETDQATEPEQAPVASVKIMVDEPEEVAEEIPVEVEPEAETKNVPEPAGTVQTDEEKKYKPPEGPIQFKRAEVPIQPLKPGEPRPEQIDELSEDEALARAFEAPKSTAKAEKKPKAPGSKLKTSLILLIILILAGGGAVAGVPSLRQKAKDLIGLGKKIPATSTTTAATTSTPAATPLSPDIYVSKRDGIYNVYKLSVAGQQEQLILAGTGNEESDLVLAPNTATTTAALVSTRDGKKDSSGNLQESIALVTVADGKVSTLDTAAHIKLVDWFGDRLVYVTSTTSTSTTDANRYQLISYNVATKTRTVLDHANYLNDVVAAKGTVYYATAASSGVAGQFLAIKPDATGKQGILSAEVAAITRTSYDTFILSTVNKWYSYHLGDLEATATNAVQSQSRQYVDSPDGKHSVYLNKSNVVLVDTANGKETPLAVTSASYPVRWLSNDTIVYRNTADYQVKITGGQPTRLVDVSDVAGISLWRE